MERIKNRRDYLMYSICKLIVHLYRNDDNGFDGDFYFIKILEDFMADIDIDEIEEKIKNEYEEG